MAIDPEPADKKSPEYRAWLKRSLDSPPAVDAPAGKVAVMPDPNVFGAQFIASCQAYAGISTATPSQVRTAWHIHRGFVEWVNSGEDIVAYEVACAKEREAEERIAEVARRDKEAEDARRAASVRAFNEKQAADAAVA